MHCSGHMFTTYLGLVYVGLETWKLLCWLLRSIFEKIFFEITGITFSLIALKLEFINHSYLSLTLLWSSPKQNYLCPPVIAPGVEGGRYVKHFKVLQQIPGERLKFVEPIRRFPTAPPSSGNATSLGHYLLLKIDDGALGQVELLAYNAPLNKFIPVGAVDFAAEILHVQVLRVANAAADVVVGEVVFLQTRRAGEQLYRNHLLDFDGVANKFRILHEFSSHEPIRVQMLSTDKGIVMAQFCPRLATVDLFAVKWITKDRISLGRIGEIGKRGVADVVSLGSNHVALLIEKKQVGRMFCLLITGNYN